MTRPPIDPESALAALRRPTSEEELVSRLGLDPDDPATDEALDDLLDDPRIVPIGDGRLAAADRLVDGLVLWHRVDEVEVATRVVGLGIDVLPVLVAVADDGSVLVGEHEVPFVAWPGSVPDVDREPALPLPPGWAPRLAAGDLVSVVVEEGRLRLLAPARPGGGAGGAAGSGRRRRSAADLAAAVTAVALAAPYWRLRFLLDEGVAGVAGIAGIAGIGGIAGVEGIGGEPWVLDVSGAGPALLADHAPALRSLARIRVPLGEALVEGGLAHSGGVVRGPGVSDRSLETYLVGRVVARDVDPRSTSIFEACGITWGALAGDGWSEVDVDLSAEVVREMVDDPFAADRVVEHLRLVTADVASEAERRLRVMCRSLPGHPGLRWLHATCLIAQRRPHDAQEVLEEVVASLGAPGEDDLSVWSSAAGTAAHLRLMGGDLTGAADLLGRLGQVHLVREIDGWAQGDPSTVELLWWKLRAWSRRHGSPSLHPFDTEADLDVAAVMDLHAIAASIAMLEAGELAGALEEVGALLPPVEREWASRWRQAGHSVWRAGSVEDRGHWLDLVTGETAPVAGWASLRMAGPTPSAGDVVLAALLPGPDGHVVVGPALPVREDVDMAVDIVGARPGPVALMLTARALLAGTDGAPPAREAA